MAYFTTLIKIVKIKDTLIFHSYSFFVDMDKIVLSTMSSPQQTLFEHFKISTNKGSFVSHFNPHTLTTYTRAVNKMTKIPE